MPGIKLVLALGATALLTGAAVILWDSPRSTEPGDVALDAKVEEGGKGGMGESQAPRLPHFEAEFVAYEVEIESGTETSPELPEGMMISDTGHEIFTRERAILETSRVLLETHMPSATTFDSSYTRWPEEVTQENSKAHFGRDLTSEEIARIQAIHDEHLPDMLAYASLMRAEYGDILRVVEATRSYDMFRIELEETRAHTPQNHNVITMPGWRVTYPVGYDTYPHLLVTAKAASSLRKKRDHAVSNYLSSSR